jgi:two-component system sensor histidine kinase BaeS
VKRIRLRWRLALSHALLAIVLVVFAGQRIQAQSKVAARADATAITERDADVLAASASRAFDNKAALDDLVTDEETGSRKAQVIGADLIPIAGSDLQQTSAGTDAVSRAMRLSAPAISLGKNDTMVVASPIVVNATTVGVALVSEQIPSRAPGLSSFGVFNWLGALIVAIAALAGWLLATWAAQPIDAVTDTARSLALGSPARRTARRALPEVDTLTAAIQGIAGRERRHEDVENERRRTLRALSHRLSHQLRTPLSVLRLRLDDLADPSLGDSRRAVLVDVVADQIGQLDRLGQELAEMDPARWELRTEPIDIGTLVAEVVERNRPLATWGGISMNESLLPAGSAVVNIDSVLVDDAITNVVQNAIKYTGRGGHIDVTMSRDHRELAISVADTGPGIPSEEREHVLRSGVRGSAAAETEGTGQGLGLAADTMERHGGRIELTDAPQRGAVVRLILPLP